MFTVNKNRILTPDEQKEKLDEIEKLLILIGDIQCNIAQYGELASEVEKRIGEVI